MTLGEGVRQLYVFFAFVCLGVLLAVVFALFSKVNGKWTLLSDAAVGALGVFAVWKLNLIVNDGEMRLFVLLGLFCGVAIAQLTCKSVLDRISKVLYNLATLKKVAENETVLQKKHVNSCSGGNNSVDISAVHVVDSSHSTQQPQTDVGKVAGVGGRSKKRRERQTGID